MRSQFSALLAALPGVATLLGAPIAAGIEALRAACGAEIDRLCDAVPRGSGRLMRCLRSKDEADLSEKCGYLDLLSSLREKRMSPDE